ncbi:uncharacterized protein C8Q71DRAFT_229767 [Rhodofomes roseus]|uniref:Uncharacterized protein n=1 Tax=Rhodofomes roseus TaxID=34475 RepID=A0ABQ8KVB6_9APHY|nr:uncharacterized protein C8Q71DRAFT_229767 [Rhodofomes roseus]KAH9842974.1 hypothetical protein C8Q71DRAFT_229767 [Rhodofomes roseus]
MPTIRPDSTARCSGRSQGPAGRPRPAAASKNAPNCIAQRPSPLGTQASHPDLSHLPARAQPEATTSIFAVAPSCICHPASTYPTSPAQLLLPMSHMHAMQRTPCQPGGNTVHTSAAASSGGSSVSLAAIMYSQGTLLRWLPNTCPGVHLGVIHMLRDKNLLRHVNRAHELVSMTDASDADGGTPTFKASKCIPCSSRCSYFSAYYPRCQPSPR